MVWSPWTRNGMPRINGFFNFEDGDTIWLGTPGRCWSSLESHGHSTDRSQPPADGSFVVESGFGWNIRRAGRLNIIRNDLRPRILSRRRIGIRDPGPLVRRHSMELVFSSARGTSYHDAT